MEAIRCGGCGRRCVSADAVCLFCGADPRPAAASRPSIARRVGTMAGAALVTTAIVAAPVFLGACVCTVQQPQTLTDSGPHTDAGPGGDAGR